MNRPLVSVVLPTFNMAQYLPEALSSVFAQDYRPLEVVVVNDASTDRTEESARRAFSMAPAGMSCTLVNLQKNGGAANALKTGFLGSAGEYVCWLSADDAFVDKSKTTTQSQAMEKRRLGWSYFEGFRVGATRDVAVPAGVGYMIRASFLDPMFVADPSLRLMMMMFRNPVNGSSVMIRRSCFETFGLFDPYLRNIDPDGDLWLRYNALGLGVLALPGAPIFYRQHASQTSGNPARMLFGSELVRLRLASTLADLGLLHRLEERFMPVFSALLARRQVAFPYTAHFLCQHILGRKRRHSPLSLLTARLALPYLEIAKRSSGVDEDGLNEAVRRGLASDEFHRFSELLAIRA